MNKKSNATVIIPCYNDGAFIHKALASVLNQTVAPEKIIIIDDGSNQETKSILQTFSYPMLEIIYQPNQGVSVARNNAIKKVTTDYIVNLDADDYYEPTFIEKALNVFHENENIVAVSSFCRSFDSKSQTVEIIEPLGGGVKDFIIKNNGRASAMFKRSSWAQVGGFDEQMLNGYEDWEFWIAILKSNARMAILPEVLSHYRIKASSRDKTALKSHDYELRKYIYNKHKDVFLQDADFYILELLRQNSMFRNTVNKIRDDYDYKIGSTILKPVRFFKNLFKK